VIEDIRRLMLRLSKIASEERLGRREASTTIAAQKQQ
jgi:hypothetical protein